jgi:hypothetical protein
LSSGWSTFSTFQREGNSWHILVRPPAQEHVEEGNE